MNTLSFFNPRFTSDLFDVIDRNFNDYGYGENGKSAMPRVDVSEKKDSYVLEMELPGYTENDVELDLKDRVLTISSKLKDAKKAEKEEKKEAAESVYLIKERRNSTFSRSFTMPEDIDQEKVSAAFKNGLLTVIIPRKAEAQTKRIMISVA
jgi:HSP20 family protein